MAYWSGFLQKQFLQQKMFIFYRAKAFVQLEFKFAFA